MTPARRTPTSTYRLQLQPDFPFSAAEELVPYAASLGVSHLHLSPVLEAVPGSLHGYDVTDHTRVRAELGGEEGLRALADAARARGLGLVLDIVPNHMAVPGAMELNGPLWEVLRDGPEAERAGWFDIDWAAGGGRVLLPVLGGPLGEELDRLSVVDGTLRYADRRFPLRPGTEELPLPDLLDEQHYRLAWWRLGRTEINYRRFFAISELIGVRVEEPEVFAATHALVLRLLDEGLIDGLRVDHPDGLADPGGYLERLHRATGGAWIVAEKILGPGERLPASWPVAGTTGYDAMRFIDAMFTEADGAAELTEHYRAFTGAPPDLGGEWTATVRRAAYKMITHELAAETERLTRAAVRVCAAVPELRVRDHAPWTLRSALVELLVRLPVYRPYVTGDAPPSPVDEAMLVTAADGARTMYAVPAEAAAVDTVRELALGRFGEGDDLTDFRVRFAQVASALRAKAVEDTACYRYAPLLSAAEVGGDPGEPALPPAAFHAFCERIQRHWPLTGTALSTHDTKRSGDIRATLASLSEHPHGWAELVTRLTEETARAGVRAPDPHVAWTTWQTAFAMGFPDRERLLGTVLKTVREAGLHTSWTEPDESYEAALERFVLAGPCGPPLYPLTEFARELEPQVRANVLGTALLHLTMPGVPDVYRGSERHYLALVDPDNRRLPQLPVAQLAALDDALATGYDLATEKLRLTATALRLRRAQPEWFGELADYEPLPAEGIAAEHCLAFARSGRVVAVVTRLSRRLAAAGGWEGTYLPLPPGPWRDLLTGHAVSGKARLGQLLAANPVALLVRED
ncbi:malto-oligosyltrehalose synthase [Streptomyces radicis]|uniref:Malto-oligosyltrehalose synthase n=1 Tax=Streptomyces radicis TaxID=1750517 RepID=A0A3A9W728_9ACTN|nr:malto-oligosyltrehalose synthase [Streptomyces radicis]RKN03306.1 malto-oligosyltrehalose synthase [Streptomyces radicis]RKN13189.1 malto-oligosyltrehalose synthase [Streptomyces radicis]